MQKLLHIPTPPFFPWDPPDGALAPVPFKHLPFTALPLTPDPSPLTLTGRNQASGSPEITEPVRGRGRGCRRGRGR